MLPTTEARNWNSYYANAVGLIRQKGIKGAQLFYDQLIALHSIQDPDELLSDAYSCALLCTTRLHEWAKAETIARQAIKRFPTHSTAYQYLGEALLRQGNREAAAAALRTSIVLEPEQVEARVLLQLAQPSAIATADRRQRAAPWPKLQTFADPVKLIQRYLLKEGAEPFIVPTTQFLALGSCFARTLGERLAAAGYHVQFESMGEEVNSTYANRYLLEWIEKGPVSGPTLVMQKAYGDVTRQRLLCSIKNSDVVVLTLGVAPCFFSRDTGEFAFFSTRSATMREYMHEAYSMRTTSVSENAHNIGLILQYIHRLSQTNPRIVLTVSPIPLAGTTEFDSAIIADCLSKSTLRVACEEALSAAKENNVVYWPSFEIVRWLGAHFSQELPPVFGADDGNSRHVSAWLVDIIIDQFLSCYAIRRT